MYHIITRVPTKKSGKNMVKYIYLHSKDKMFNLFFNSVIATTCNSQNKFDQNSVGDNVIK